MADSIVARPGHVDCIVREFAQPAPPASWTPAHHAKTSSARPVRLLEAGEGPRGKFARFEFPEGWERVIDLPTEADAHHPMFDDLPYEQRRQLHRHGQPAPVMGHDGRRKIHSPLSFTTKVPTVRGCGKDCRFFDVPVEDYGQGTLTGYRAAGELLEALERDYGPHVPVQHILADAHAAMNAPHDAPSRRGAAVGFVSIIVDALRFAAKNCNHRKHVAARAHELEHWRAEGRKREAEDKARFVERMCQAREAKRAANA